MGQRRMLLADLEQLVDLLLIFDDRQLDAGVVADKRHFSGTGILVHRHRDRAQRLHRDHGGVQTRPVLADQRHMAAPGHAQARQTGGDRLGLDLQVMPVQGLPDAERFLFHTFY